MNAIPPQETFVVEIEQDALGAMMLANDTRRVSNILRAEHFLEPFHAFLFDHIIKAFDRYGSTSPVIVQKVIPPEEAAAWGARLGKSVQAYLASLVANCVTGAAGLDRTARKVVEQWARVRLSEEAARIATAAAAAGSDPIALVTSAGQAFEDIVSDVRAGPRRKTRVSLAEASRRAIEAAQAARERGSGLTGITWGLTDVNRLTGGIQPRDLTLIAARPSMGKTTVALSCALRAAKAGHGVGFLSLEMDADKLAARAISDLAYDWTVQVPYIDIIRGSTDPSAMDALASATRDIDGLPLWIDDQSGLSMTDVRVKIERMMQDGEKLGTPLRVVFLDHLGLLKPSSRYSGNRVHEISEMTATAKALAREYDIAFVMLSQLNRAVENRDNKRPQLSDLRDSGSIEQDADTIIFLYRDAYYLEREKGKSAEAEIERTEKLLECQNKLELIIAKQRNGPLATIELFVDMGCSAVRSGAAY